MSSQQPGHKGSCRRLRPITPTDAASAARAGPGEGPHSRGRNHLQRITILLIHLLLTDFLLQGRQLGLSGLIRVQAIRHPWPVSSASGYEGTRSQLTTGPLQKATWNPGRTQNTAGALHGEQVQGSAGTRSGHSPGRAGVGASWLTVRSGRKTVTSPVGQHRQCLEQRTRSPSGPCGGDRHEACRDRGILLQPHCQRGRSREGNPHPGFPASVQNASSPQKQAERRKKGTKK